MLVVESYPLAAAFCVVTMLCWGSWANTQKKMVSQQWPFQLFYWDYLIGVLLLTLAFAFTIGSAGEEGRSFLPDISQVGGDAITTALLDIEEELVHFPTQRDNRLMRPPWSGLACRYRGR
jgi:glucose uptake protein